MDKINNSKTTEKIEHKIHHFHKHINKKVDEVVAVIKEEYGEVEECCADQCMEAKQFSWTWCMCVTFLLKVAVYSFVLLGLIVSFYAGFRYTFDKHQSQPIDNVVFTPKDIEGWEVLGMLKENLKAAVNTLYFIPSDNQNSNNSQTQQNENNGFLSLDENGNIIIKDSFGIEAVQTKEMATVFIKQNTNINDNSIRFVAFRKPKHSDCAAKDYSFQTNCVKAHNVRSMSFSDSNELMILIAGSQPRSIIINENTTVILNDRLFRIQANQLIEEKNASFYESGNKYCQKNVSLQNDTYITNNLNNDNEYNVMISQNKYRIVVSGECHGTLYLPRQFFLNDDSIRLLASRWSSIIVDSRMYAAQLQVAANYMAAIYFRAHISAMSLSVASTENSYIEFTGNLREAKFVHFALHVGANLKINNLIDIQTVQIATRNYSRIEILNAEHCDEIDISATQFSYVELKVIEEATVTYVRDNNARVVLPKENAEIDNSDNNNDNNNNQNYMQTNLNDNLNTNTNPDIVLNSKTNNGFQNIQT